MLYDKTTLIYTNYRKRKHWNECHTYTIGDASDDWLRDALVEAPEDELVEAVETQVLHWATRTLNRKHRRLQGIGIAPRLRSIRTINSCELRAQSTEKAIREKVRVEQTASRGAKEVTERAVPIDIYVIYYISGESSRERSSTGANSEKEERRRRTISSMQTQQSPSEKSAP